MKIVLASDIHYGNMACPSEEGEGPFTKDDHRKFAKLLHKEKPDVLVVAGDIAETNWGSHLLKEFLETYRNPHGDSLFVTGNHDMWCVDNGIEPETKYAWHFVQAEKYGWRMLRNRPWEKDGVFVAGSMGWFDFSAIPPETGRNPEWYAKNRGFSDYHYMGWRSVPASLKDDPMVAFAAARMSDFRTSLGQVPKDRKRLVVVSHIVGFKQLMGPWRDEFSAYFGNFNIGKEVLKAKPDLYYCGHTHRYAECRIQGVRCVNNGSGYGVGSKRYDVVEF